MIYIYSGETCETFAAKVCEKQLHMSTLHPVMGQWFPSRCSHNLKQAAWYPRSPAHAIPPALWDSPLSHSLIHSCTKWKPLWDCLEGGTPRFWTFCFHPNVILPLLMSKHNDSIYTVYYIVSLPVSVRFSSSPATKIGNLVLPQIASHSRKLKSW